MNTTTVTYDQREAHPCAFPGCKDIVEFDDEAYCSPHSSTIGAALDNGCVDACVEGYSYRRWRRSRQGS
jgi:hypothetical protein